MKNVRGKCNELLRKLQTEILAKNSSLFCIVVVYSTRLLHYNQLMLRCYNSLLFRFFKEVAVVLREHAFKVEHDF